MWIAVILIIAITVAISALWVDLLEKQMNDPEWQEHKDDPDYWDWP